MRETWVGTGWKMNHTLQDSRVYVARLHEYARKRPAVGMNIFIVPPFTVLYDACAQLKGTPIKVGAQNMHWERRGAFTGEISPLMVKDTGVDLVELGHSERRALFAETDVGVNKKTLAALEHGLRPLICVGETVQTKAYGVTREVVVRQVKEALFGVNPGDISRVLIAYEPVWAIGEGGTAADPVYVQQVHRFIRGAVQEIHGADSAEALPILYGGSVGRTNALPYVRQPDVDGLFIGRAAWQVDGLIELIEIVRTHKGL